MKNLYINTEIQDFVYSKDKPNQIIPTPEFYVGDVKDYSIFFVKSDKTYDNVSGSVVKVAVAPPRKGAYSGNYLLTIGDYSGSFEYNSSPSDIITELLSNGIEAEVHGRDGALDINLLNSTASISVDIKNLQPACSGYVYNYTGSAYQIRMVPKPYGYLESVANITSGSSVIGVSASFSLSTVEAVSGVGSRNVAVLIEVEVGGKTALQKETKLINEIINDGINDFEAVSLPHFLTDAIVDGKLNISDYQVDSGSFNNKINAKLNESTYNTFTSSFNQAISLSTSTIYDQSNKISIDYNVRALFDGDDNPSLDWAGRVLSDAYGNQVLSYSNVGDASITLASAVIGGVFHGYVISADGYPYWAPSQGIFYDGSGNYLIDLVGNVLYSYSYITDSYIQSVDWSQRKLFGADNVLSVDYTNRFLMRGSGVLAIDWSGGSMNSENGTQNYNFSNNIFHNSASFVNSGRIFGEYIQSSSTNSGTYTYGASSVNNSNISLWLSGSAATSLTCSVTTATANMPVGAEFTIMTSNAITSLNLLTSPTIVGTALTSMTAGQTAIYKKVNSNTLFRTQ